jgi:hypothetical protein
MKKINISTEIQNKICKMYEQGIGCTSIANFFKIQDCNKIYNILRANQIKIKPRGSYTKYKFTENFFENVNSECKAYWLGFIIADGSIDSKRNSLQIGLAEKDVLHIYKFKNDISASHPIFTRYVEYNELATAFTPKSGSYYSHITLISSKMVQHFAKYGLGAKKTFTVKLPNIDEILKPCLWRGIFDGDGYIYIAKKINKKGKIQMQLEVGISCNEFIADSFMDFLSLNKIKGKKITDKSIFCVRITCKNAFNFLQLIYNDSKVYLDRKYQKYCEYKDFYTEKVKNKVNPPGIYITKSNTYKTYTTKFAKQTYIGTFTSLEEALNKQAAFSQVKSFMI